MKRLRVLQICSYYQGTALYEELFSHLSQEEVESKILYFASKTSDLSDWDDRFITSAVYRPMDRYVFHVKHRKVYRDIEGRIEGFALSHAHSLVSNGYIAWRLKREKGIPYIATVRNTDLNVFLRWVFYLRPMIYRILEEARAVIFLSPAYREALLAKLPSSLKEKVRKKSVLIPNGIHDDFHHEGRVHESIHHPLRLAFVSRSIEDPNKNLKTLLSALPLLEKRGISARVEAVGEGEWKAEGVKTYGKKNRREIMEFYRSADLFVMPSKKETFGLVYAEAMSQGLPVIYTKGQGFDGQFPEGVVGYGVDSSKPLEIAVAVERILSDYENFSRRAKKESENFTWSDIARRTKSLYEEVLQ